MSNHLNLDRCWSLVRAVAVAFTVCISSVGAANASPINVNTATQTELESIKGIGPSKAKTIIAERLDGGHFQDANDLQKRVRGIGMKSVEKMVDNGLTIEAPSSFREPNGRTKKESSASGRRNARNQASPRNQQERTGEGRRN
ncbi:helix-hairpin-helix domain-containing protein [Polynucleobacter sp. JS-Safj-400b-B2]|uniref:ComEA family DNA-binding protein n=1 Tax=Polynucleobacter sp. JS-Safj-400b-B2 TaxID=2576921 RepID=UPI001C0AEC09|nr:helix-hairpin-helix domain-containing protein [Polynucleobacter sp. JS-Safj-400b-B2]MBU3626930.1 helix-hairpin-helix domain-containing protein [Polynucleobacter sp. JS-Safj-400b-B2]